jgi:hypothetical protein
MMSRRAVFTTHEKSSVRLERFLLLFTDRVKESSTVLLVRIEGRAGAEIARPAPGLY